jgi:SSS family transporter
MIWIDWLVILAYFAGIIGFAAARSRSQRDLHDYYLAGRTTPWWQSGFSTMATQLGAISFVSAPAFVAIKEGGGMRWLCYEFGVPLGILLVTVVIIPVLHRHGRISIYEYLEERFDRSTRLLVSALFQLGRGLATAVSVLAGGLILSTALPISTAQAIIVIGLVTILYDMLGGIRVVIVSDFAQMLIITAGIVICAGAALSLVGWDFAWQVLSPDRMRILDFSRAGFSAGGEYSFWPMAIGGIFLYASYYGCDQSQVQREMSVGSLGGVRKSLLLNAFGRFPMVMLYCVMGVFVGAVFVSPDHLSILARAMGMSTASLDASLEANPDRMVPMFILSFLPPGVVGLLFVAILSALMSSLDSAINSLSAVTMEDFYKPHLKPSASERHYLAMSKVLTVVWGVFCIVAALTFSGFGESTRQTTIVLINAVGSLLYGPILAAFLLGILSREIGATNVKFGVVIGIAGNLLLWQLTEISWLWWNLAGFLVTLIVAYLLSIFGMVGGFKLLDSDLLYSGNKSQRGWRLSNSIVALYFFAIIAVTWLIQS